MAIQFQEDTVLKILALGLDNNTPQYRIEYLLKKLYGKDSLGLDSENITFFNSIKEISEKIKWQK